MTLSLLAAFCLTTILIDLTPGPAVMKVIGDALGNGWRKAQASVAGILAANALYCLLSALGLSALLLAAPLMFEAVKWAGAAYLVWLGLKAIKNSGSALETDAGAAAVATPGTMFRSSLVVQISNPKSFLYFSAILPAFASVAEKTSPAILALGFLSLVTEYTVLSFYSLLSGRLRAKATGKSARRALTLLNGAALFAVAAMVARTSFRTS